MTICELKEKIRVFLIGRTFLYLLNAEADADLAAQLIAYSRKPNFGRLKNQRVKKLLEASDPSASQAIYLAYGQYIANGLADYLTGQLFLKILKIFNQDKAVEKINQTLNQFRRGLIKKDNYREYAGGFLDTLFSLLIQIGGFILGKLPFKKQFRKIFSPKKTRLFKRKVFEAIILIQNQNISHNQNLKKEIEKAGKTDNPKLRAILTLAGMFPESQEKMLRAVSQSLEAASFWDRLFRWYLGIIFPY
ncbi:MAG: hypothetical protein JW991_04200 [Candidatus Pacebacteria bacterium]|nr:hypothetical protein [Candidatus Paceibacterota bacterium]